MLKRKLYFLMIGIVVSHLSVAQLLNDSPSKAGDCVDCNRPSPSEVPNPTPQELPLNEDLLEKLNGLVHGPGVSAPMPTYNPEPFIHAPVEPQAPMSIFNSDMTSTYASWSPFPGGKGPIQTSIGTFPIESIYYGSKVYQQYYQAPYKTSFGPLYQPSHAFATAPSIPVYQSQFYRL